MQFNEDNEKDNEEFSLDDAGAISWQDLLNEDNDEDSILLDIADKEEASNNTEKKASIADFDISSLDSSEESINNAVQSDFNNAPQTVENSDSASVDYNNTGGINENYYVQDSDILNEDNDAQINIKEAEVDGLIDDELLNLLDDKQDKEEQAPFAPAPVSNEQESFKTYAAQEQEIQETIPVVKQVENVQIDTEPKVNNNPPYEEVQDDINIEQPQPQKKKTPVLLILILLILIVGGAAYGAYMLSDAASKMEQNPINPINAVNPINNPNNTTAAAPDSFDIDNIDEESQKRTQELLDQMEKTQSASEIAPQKVKKAVKADEKTVSSAAKSSKKKLSKDAETKVAKTDKKPEEKKNEKVIVKVSSAGRKNPFVPSSLFDDRGGVLFDANLPMPPEDNEVDPNAVEIRKLLTITVTGIMYDPSKPSAILRFDGKDYFVQKGDRIDTYTVSSVTKDYVTISNTANTYKAYVGETFEVDANIPASQKMQIRNGKRQYISSDDIKVTKKK